MKKIRLFIGVTLSSVLITFLLAKSRNVLQSATSSTSHLDVSLNSETSSISHDQDINTTSSMGYSLEAPRDPCESFMIPFMLQKGLKVRNVSCIRPPVPLTAWERWILSTPKLTDFNSAPDERKSQVKVMTPRQPYRIGDKLQVRVDLYDARGQPRTTGGDEIRIWLTSPSSTPSAVTSVAAEVTDMRNGSYIGETILPWSGEAHLHVSLTYPREYLRVLVELFHTLHTNRFLSITYKNRQLGVEEETLCLPYLPVPGYSAICNLTSYNGGFPWFCGHPTDSRLNCSHRTERWGFVDTIPLDKVPPMSPAKTLLVQKILREPFQKKIETKISIVVSQEQTQSQKPLPPCWTIPRRDTWHTPAPLGWFQDGLWRPRTCTRHALTPSLVQRCLRNTTLYLLGDSTSRDLWNTTKSMMNCTRVENVEAWHAPKLCEVEHDKTAIRFAVHSMPFYAGHHVDLVNVPLTTVLRQLPNNTNVVLVVYFNLHFVPYGLHVYRDRVRYVRALLQNHLTFRPDTKVLIRGPHVNYDSRHFENDYFGPQFISIWREEFKRLYDKIWFVDFWDMTIASENMLCHPPAFIYKEMVSTLFGYFCKED